MKKYQNPDLRKHLFQTEDVIATSGDTQSIVSPDDAQDVSETQESSWDPSWS